MHIIAAVMHENIRQLGFTIREAVHKAQDRGLFSSVVHRRSTHAVDATATD